MARYVAFLRGISPMNAKMSELKKCFEKAGFQDVKTVLASGNVVFSASRATPAALEKKIHQAMEKHLDRVFGTLVRSVEEVQAILESDPYVGTKLKAEAKRVVTFLRRSPAPSPVLPVSGDGACIYRCIGREVYSYYVPSPKGPVFMQKIEKLFGKDVTTRTWGTLQKVVR